MSPRRFALAVVAGVLAWALLIGLGFLVWSAVTGDESPRESRQGRVEEDDPAWDCRTMGNGQCGAGQAA